MAWDFKSDRSIYLQIIDHFIIGIISGEFLPGSKVASVRELAAEASVNPNTMQRALTELERQGFLYTQRTTGRFITEDIEVIDNAKNRFATENVQGFLKRMKKLGLNKKEIINFIENYYEED